MSKTIAAVFHDNYGAENAARQIRDEGYRTEDISIVARHEDQDDNETRTEMRNAEGEVKDNISDGVVSGGVLGGLAGLLIGAGSMVVPGLGIIAAAGPITGLISGAVTGGIVGGLVDLGIPENKSKQYETDVKAGKILFTMQIDEESIDRMASILRDNGAESVETF